eukprot:Unigene668_Nuclearia_a/m.2103 Unigene668_Nuclearia_a/g.2103  ORF Unigene668_Nuclearia_a/g.2103 Unigene668_Nuclearia_a/m.2103 type:complete len:477 (-) Unigene668_Nuclearia_a:51-1481(-)
MTRHQPAASPPRPAMPIALRPRNTLSPPRRQLSASWAKPAASPAASPAAKKQPHRRATTSRRLFEERPRAVPVRFMNEFLRYYTRTAAAAATATAAAAAAAVVAPLPPPPRPAHRAHHVHRAHHMHRAAAHGDAGGDDDGPALPCDAPKQGVYHYAAHVRPASQPARLEVVFSFDTTGSMSAYIDQVKREVTAIATQLTGDMPELRVGIIAHGDYQDEHDKYVLKRLDLSNDVDVITRFVRRCERTHGYDGPECLELVLLEAQDLSWTPAAQKVLVVISDAPPHRASEYRGIDWRHELGVLKGMGVRCYGVRCGGEAAFYEAIAQETDGKVLELRDLQQIGPMMLELCYREGANVQLDAAPEGVAAAAAAAFADMTAQERADHLAVHRAIHAHEASVILPSTGATLAVSLGLFGCRYVRAGGVTYVQQNQEDASRHARMAAEGTSVTWMVRAGKWACIVDDSITVTEPEVAPALPM